MCFDISGGKKPRRFPCPCTNISFRRARFHTCQIAIDRKQGNQFELPLDYFRQFVTGTSISKLSHVVLSGVRKLCFRIANPVLRTGQSLCTPKLLRIEFVSGVAKA